MRKRLAILCSDDAHHRYLVSTLWPRFQVVAVVIEPAAAQRRRLRRTGRHVDYGYAVYHALRRQVLGLNAYRRRYFVPPDAVWEQAAGCTRTVEWINDPQVVEFLRQTAPDVTVVMGTSILRRQVLEVAGEVVLNIHGGFLPDYRGNHCFFFALYHGAFDKIGATIHYVDPGIDTGDIVEVVVPPLYPNDMAEALYCRAELMAIHRLAAWLEHLDQGGTLPRRPQTQRGKLYRTRDRKFHHDLLLWLRRETGWLAQPDPSADGGRVSPHVEQALRLPSPGAHGEGDGQWPIAYGAAKEESTCSSSHIVP